MENGQKTTHNKGRTVIIGNTFLKGDYRRDIKDQLLLSFPPSSAVNSDIIKRPQKYPRSRRYVSPRGASHIQHPTSKGRQVLKQISSENLHRFNAKKKKTMQPDTLLFPTSSATLTDGNAIYLWANTSHTNIIKSLKESGP